MIKYIKDWLGGVLKFEVGFQDSGTGFAEALVNLYNVVGFFLVLVFVMVMYLFIVILLKCVFNSNINNIFSLEGLFLQGLNNKLNFKEMASIYEGKARINFLKVYDISEYHTLEKAWTLFPASILISVIVPSFSVEYWLDPKVSPYMVVKVIGNQWYWSYECVANLTKLGLDTRGKQFYHSNIYLCWAESRLSNPYNWDYFREQLSKLDVAKTIKYNFDMNLIEPTEGDGVNPLRLLNVDNRLVLPVGVPIRLLITASDVLHSFALPSLGIKVDAVPGRLSSFMVFIDRPGLFFGQCSELCGPMHGFMPIVIEAVSVESYIEYALSNEEAGDKIIREARPRFTFYS